MDAGLTMSDDGSADGSVDGSAVPDDASADGAVADGGGCTWVADCSDPPPSFARCGGGDIDPAAVVAACDALDPIAHLGVDLTLGCSAFSAMAGRYEVWCGAGEVYVWVSLDLTSSDVRRCSFVVPVPGGGSMTAVTYGLSWDLLDSNNEVYGRSPPRSGQLVDAEFGSSSEEATEASWTGSMAFDGRLSVSSATSGSATLYYVAGEADCDGIPIAASRRVVAAVRVAWSL